MTQYNLKSFYILYVTRCKHRCTLCTLAYGWGIMAPCTLAYIAAQRLSPAGEVRARPGGARTDALRTSAAPPWRSRPPWELWTTDAVPFGGAASRFSRAQRRGAPGPSPVSRNGGWPVGEPRFVGRQGGRGGQSAASGQRPRRLDDRFEPGGALALSAAARRGSCVPQRTRRSGRSRALTGAAHHRLSAMAQARAPLRGYGQGDRGAVITQDRLTPEAYGMLSAAARTDCLGSRCRRA